MYAYLLSVRRPLLNKAKHNRAMQKRIALTAYAALRLPVLAALCNTQGENMNQKIVLPVLTLLILSGCQVNQVKQASFEPSTPQPQSVKQESSFVYSPAGREE